MYTQIIIAAITQSSFPLIFKLLKNLYYKHIFITLSRIESSRRLNITHLLVPALDRLFKTSNNLPTRLLAKGTFS